MLFLGTPGERGWNRLNSGTFLFKLCIKTLFLDFFKDFILSRGSRCMLLLMVLNYPLKLASPWRKQPSNLIKSSFFAVLVIFPSTPLPIVMIWTAPLSSWFVLFFQQKKRNISSSSYYLRWFFEERTTKSTENTHPSNYVFVLPNPRTFLIFFCVLLYTSFAKFRTTQ